MVALTFLVPKHLNYLIYLHSSHCCIIFFVNLLWCFISLLSVRQYILTDISCLVLTNPSTAVRLLFISVSRDFAQDYDTGFCKPIRGLILNAFERHIIAKAHNWKDLLPVTRFLQEV